MSFSYGKMKIHRMKVTFSAFHGSAENQWGIIIVLYPFWVMILFLYNRNIQGLNPLTVFCHAYVVILFYMTTSSTPKIKIVMQLR